MATGEDALAGDEPPLDVILADESAEIASEGEVRSTSGGGVPIEEDATNEKPLPPMDALVARLPEQVSEALESLFRARFTRVTRVPGSALEARAKAVSGGK